MAPSMVQRRGKEITPRRRAVIIAYRQLNPPLPYSFIKAVTGVAKTTCYDIYKHALNNARMKHEAKDACQPYSGAEESRMLHTEQHTKENAEQQSASNAESQAERNAEQHATRNAEQQAERNTEQHAERNAEQHAERNAEQHVERNAELHVKRNSGYHTGRNAGQQAEQWAGQCAEQHAEQCAEQHAEQYAEQRTKQCAEQRTKQCAKQCAEKIPQPEFSLLDLINANALDPKPRSGRPSALTLEEKEHLAKVVKRSFPTRRMRLVDLRREADLSHVSDTTVFRALHEQGFKAYHEEFKFILTAENKAERMAYCCNRSSWIPEKEWANYAFTDEMSIEVGGTFGVSFVWRQKDERWQDDCV